MSFNNNSQDHHSLGFEENLEDVILNPEVEGSFGWH
jgi:hypothetical protein